MKNIITTIAATLIVIASFSSFAAEKSNPLKNYTSANIVNIYLEATTLGDTEMNKFLFANDFEYQNTANHMKFSKKEYLDFLKANKGIKFDCKTSYEILDEGEQACIARATMEFATFTRVDYITMSHTEEGWKVSKVVTSYR